MVKQLSRCIRTEKGERQVNAGGQLACTFHFL